MDDETASLTHGLSCCDEHAWRAFHDLYYPQLINLARARGMAEGDLPDIVQGVYLRVLRHAKIIHDEQSFKAWLACLVRCEVIDHSRRKGRRSWLNERFQQWQETRRETGSGDACGELEDAMHALCITDRTLIRRHYIDGWSQQKLAEENRISVKAVESKLARLRKRLRHILENPTPETE
jgi:RNA polymerase sigma factor (sigma-70 family)